MVGEIRQNVIPDVDPLGDGEVVPVGGNEVREGVGRDEFGVVRGGVVEDVLALGDEVGGGLEGEEAALGFLAGDGLAVFGGGWRADVQCFAEGLHLFQLLNVHFYVWQDSDILCCVLCVDVL